MDYPVAEHVLVATWNDFADDRTGNGPWGIADGDAPVDVEMAAYGTISAGGALAEKVSFAV